MWNEEYGQYGAWALGEDGQYIWYPAQVCTCLFLALQWFLYWQSPCGIFAVVVLLG